jgi:hypothetical protein
VSDTGKSSIEKINHAEKLLRLKKPYRLIQNDLKEHFGSGMSNTTLKHLQKKQDKFVLMETRIKQLEYELNLFKKLYFELKDAIRNRRKKK